MNKEIMERTIKHYGIAAQTELAIEEFSELIKEICKYRRYGNNRAHIIEELSDSQYMIDQLKYIFKIDDEEIQTQIEQKQMRTLRKMETEND